MGNGYPLGSPQFHHILNVILILINLMVLHGFLLVKKISKDLNSDNFCFDDSYDNTAEIVKNLVTCWPNSPNEIAKKIGVTLKEFQWFMSGKASLDTFSLSALQEILGFTYDGYSCVGTGPYVLIAKKP
ncbi:hypothetical protein GNT71_17810, partial [Salmonella enterica]|nr:hypothetical protein [Salmonella enterica]